MSRDAANASAVTTVLLASDARFISLRRQRQSSARPLTAGLHPPRTCGGPWLSLLTSSTCGGFGCHGHKIVRNRAPQYHGKFKIDAGADQAVMDVGGLGNRSGHERKCAALLSRWSQCRDIRSSRSNSAPARPHCRRRSYPSCRLAPQPERKRLELVAAARPLAGDPQFAQSATMWRPSPCAERQGIQTLTMGSARHCVATLNVSGARRFLELVSRGPPMRAKIRPLMQTIYQDCLCAKALKRRPKLADQHTSQRKSPKQKIPTIP